MQGTKDPLSELRRKGIEEMTIWLEIANKERLKRDCIIVHGKQNVDEWVRIATLYSRIYYKILTIEDSDRTGVDAIPEIARVRVYMNELREKKWKHIHKVIKDFLGMVVHLNSSRLRIGFICDLILNLESSQFKEVKWIIPKFVNFITSDQEKTFSSFWQDRCLAIRVLGHLYAGEPEIPRALIHVTKNNEESGLSYNKTAQVQSNAIQILTNIATNSVADNPKRAQMVVDVLYDCLFGSTEDVGVMLLSNLLSLKSESYLLKRSHGRIIHMMALYYAKNSSGGAREYYNHRKQLEEKFKELK